MILRDGPINVMQTVEVAVTFPTNKFAIVKTANTQAVKSINFSLIKSGGSWSSAELAAANFHLFKLGTPYSTSALTSANNNLLPVINGDSSRYVLDTTLNGAYANVTISLKGAATVIGYKNAPTNSNSVGYIVYSIGSNTLNTTGTTLKASVQLIQQG